jgi:hypothetical protein
VTTLSQYDLVPVLAPASLLMGTLMPLLISSLLSALLMLLMVVMSSIVTLSFLVVLSVCSSSPF